MSRIRRFATIVLPAALAGGLVFGSAFGYASSDDDAWEDADGADGADGADAPRHAPPRRTADARRVPPLPPAPPAPPVPPVPPVPPSGWSQPPIPGTGSAGGRFSVTIRNGKVHIDGLEGFTRHQLEAVREMIRNNPSIPPAVRARVLARLDRARAIIDRRLANLNTTDPDRIGDEMEKMGDELERALEGLEEELEQLGDKLGRDIAQQLGKNLAQGLRPTIRIEHDDDGDDDDDDRGRDRDRRRDRRRDRDRDRDRAGDDGSDDAGDDEGDDNGAIVGSDADASVRGAVRDLPDVALRPAQRAQIARLRTDYDRQIDVARKQLDDVSRRLEDALRDPRTSDIEIGRYVDQVSGYEAQIRKARLLTWVGARRVLDEGQRKQIEDAAARAPRK